MKHIVDTCAWSLALRRRDKSRLNPTEKQALKELDEAIQNRRAAILGPIRQEVLSGIRDKSQFMKVQNLLDPFRNEAILDADYIEAARLYNICRTHGIECGPVDIILCAVAVRLGFGILTFDQGLMRCMDVLRAEQAMH